ncbi:pyridoxamine 5'-phosphate oxidase family protein [Natrinema halophilum]|uniref:Pyridoxamine 5'-phosphate oxidase family protein n=1 Tax=Natrinema halophilum TaxID=1699371 RepID=A0A7D5KJI9_9EURY|nr:pyridoxamine 5'-phosphate oxidase family protein [Natrinema halophilum]QLG48138.1 pyridoxamine 5'-phosphate oxidase family protein [Natrinema halophilum]
MEHADYVYTKGMKESDLTERLRTGDHGVLALADGDDAYAVPLSYRYDGERILLRVSYHDNDAEKRRYLETTDTATFVRYGGSTDESWSVHIRGPVTRSNRDVDEETLNEWFPPFRLFDEAIEDVEFELYELEPVAVAGRETMD